MPHGLLTSRWVLANPLEPCNAACSRSGMGLCDKNTMATINAWDKMNFVMKGLGMPCNPAETVRMAGSWGVPFYSVAERSCSFWDPNDPVYDVDCAKAPGAPGVGPTSNAAALCFCDMREAPQSLKRLRRVDCKVTDAYTAGSLVVCVCRLHAVLRFRLDEYSMR